MKLTEADLNDKRIMYVVEETRDMFSRKSEAKDAAEEVGGTVTKMTKDRFGNWW